MAQGNSENGDEDNVVVVVFVVVVVVVVVVGGGGGVGDLVEGNTESSSMLDPHWLSMTGDILLLALFVFVREDDASGVDAQLSRGRS